MAYFPFFVDIESKNALVVGGGTVALRKVEKLLPYGVNITVAAPDILDDFYKINSITLIQQSYNDTMLNTADFVIAATNDPQLNNHISELCLSRHIPVNVVDDQEKCSFIFPALVKRGNLSIGISTGGASPSAAAFIKERIDSILPEEIDKVLDCLIEFRPIIKQRVQDETKRAALFQDLFNFCLSCDGLSEKEIKNYLDERI